MNDLPEDFGFPHPAILGSAGLEGLVRVYTLASGHSELQIMAAAWALWIVVFRGQQARRVTILAEVIVP